MPKDLRRRIFYALICAFFVVGAGAVLYASGWRLDTDPLGVAKIGGIYLRTFPNDANISLDGEIQERSRSIFEKGTLIKGLLPGKYNIEISAPGFQSWSMASFVSSSLVTNFQNIVLVPVQATIATSTVIENINLAGNTLITKTSGRLSTLSGMAIKGDYIVASSREGSMIITYATTSRHYFATSIPAATTTDIGRLGSATFERIPNDSTLFLMNNAAGLSLMRVPSGESRVLATSTVNAMTAAGGRAIWAVFDSTTRTSLISFYDISSQSLNHDADSLPGRVSAMLARDPGNLFALMADGSLYSVDLNQSSRLRVAQSVRDIVLSENAELLAILDDKGLNILSLGDGQPVGRIELPDARSIQEVAWYRDGKHIFIKYPDRTAFLDITDSELNNFPTAAASSVTEYQADRNILYFLKENVLYELAFPG